MLPFSPGKKRKKLPRLPPTTTTGNEIPLQPVRPPPLIPPWSKQLPQLHLYLLPPLPPLTRVLFLPVLLQFIRPRPRLPVVTPRTLWQILCMLQYVPLHVVAVYKARRPRRRLAVVGVAAREPAEEAEPVHGVVVGREGREESGRVQG